VELEEAALRLDEPGNQAGAVRGMASDYEQDRVAA
jgi:hypothetical protein